ncbi:MAG: YeiH family protein [Oscillospiraceae bacterium]
MNNKNSKELATGLAMTAILAVFSKYIGEMIPYHLISAGVFAMLIGMLLHPYTEKLGCGRGLNFVSKKVLKGSIVLMGATLSFSQVLSTGKYSLIVMSFTLAAAFGFGNLFGRLFHMNWKLSNLISAGTGICGGSAIAAIAPTIDAEDSDIAYAISATFIFDIVMVILFPIMGRYFGMSDMGFGLWAGTAVNDTSSVVAAGYAFSDGAGSYATIVKLTRTLSIVPVVLIFSYINQRIEAKKSGGAKGKVKVDIGKIFPWFIVAFLGMVGVKSTGIITPELSGIISAVSKFGMIMALGAIGLKTDFKKVAKSGIMPMVHGFIISALVVVVSFGVQLALGQL